MQVGWSSRSLSLDVNRPQGRWDHDSIRPGVVGSVGDALVQTRLKQGAPDRPLRWEAAHAMGQEPKYGSQISDGDTHGWSNGDGSHTRVVDSNWGGRRDFKIRNGWRMQDIRGPDKSVTEIVGFRPQYGWRTQLAEVLLAKRTGEGFLPLPNGYGPSQGDVTRGGNFPRATDTVQALNPPTGPEYNQFASAYGDLVRRTVFEAMDETSSIAADSIIGGGGTSARGRAMPSGFQSYRQQSTVPSSTSSTSGRLAPVSISSSIDL